MPRSEKFPGLPSVTEILQDVGLYPVFHGRQMEWYLSRGKALHRAIELHQEGALDEASVHPEIRPGLDAYRAFEAERKYKPIASELEVVHKGIGYVGHLDTLGWLDHDDVALIDFKYTDSPALKPAKLQLAAYRAAYEDDHEHTSVDRCYVLALSPKKGTWKLHDVTDPYAQHIFHAAVMVWRARQEV